MQTFGLFLKELPDSGPSLLKHLKDKGVKSEAVGNKQQKALGNLKLLTTASYYGIYITTVKSFQLTRSTRCSTIVGDLGSPAASLSQFFCVCCSSLFAAALACCRSTLARCLLVVCTGVFFQVYHSLGLAVCSDLFLPRASGSSTFGDGIFDAVTHSLPPEPSFLDDIPLRASSVCSITLALLKSHPPQHKILVDLLVAPKRISQAWELRIDF